MLLPQLTAAAALGLVSGTHCVAMCGPLAAAGCRGHGGVSPTAAVGYFGGRALGYAALGAVAGAVGHPVLAAVTSRSVRGLVGAALAATLVFAAVRLVAIGRPERPVRLRRRRASLAERLLPFLPTRGLGLGLVTAVFPCGALAAAVVAATSAGGAAQGAAMMAVFALASAPSLGSALVVGDRVARWLGRARGARTWLAAAALGLAGWIAVAPWLGAPMGAACACHHQAATR